MSIAIFSYCSYHKKMSPLLHIRMLIAEEDKKEDEYIPQITLIRSGRRQTIRRASATQLVFTILAAAPLIVCVRELKK